MDMKNSSCPDVIRQLCFILQNNASVMYNLLYANIATGKTTTGVYVALFNPHDILQNC